MYLGCYAARSSGLQETQSDALVHEQDLRVPEAAGGDWVLVGTTDVLSNLPDIFSASFEGIVDAYPRASALLEVALPMWLAGAGESADQALPVYLQPELPWQKSK